MHKYEEGNYIKRTFNYLYLPKRIVYNRPHNTSYKSYLLRNRYFKLKKNIIYLHNNKTTQIYR